MSVPSLHVSIVIKAVFFNKAKGLKICLCETVARKETFVQQVVVQELESLDGCQVGKVKIGQTVGPQILKGGMCTFTSTVKLRIRWDYFNALPDPAHV